jgi:hypothetical protein
MSVKIMSAVFDKSKTEGNARLILLALADCANEEGTCWPSISTISNMANVYEQTTRKYIGAMERIGLLSVEDRFDKNGRRTSNIYKINLEKLGEDTLTREIIQEELYASQRRPWDGGDSNTINHHTVAPCDTVHRVDTVNGHIGSYMKHKKEPKSEPSEPTAVKVIETKEDLDRHFPPIADAIDSRPPEIVQPASPVSGAQIPPKKERPTRQPKLADEQFLAQLKEANPRVDFDKEMRKMENWLLAHPSRQKTRPFVINWVNRVVEKLEPEDEWKPTVI